MSAAASDPLVGFRAWRATDDGGLRSLAPFSGAAWNDGPWAVAECYQGVGGAVDARGVSIVHDPPAWSCSCGIHAYYDPRSVPAAEQALVFGAIFAWGRIIAEQRGFRAERAEIIALADGPVARPIADRYGLPVLTDAEFVQYARWWGDIKPTSKKQAA